MGIIINAEDIGQDGAITITHNGANIRYVKESDLLAVKGGQSALEGERDKLRTDLANLTTQFNTEHQEHLRVRASYEEQGKQIGELENLRGQVTNLTDELNSTKTLAGQHESALATRVKNTLTNGFKVTPDKLEGKSLTDLMTMETVLAEAGGQRSTAANYDAATVPGANQDASALANKSPLQLAQSYYETTNDKKK